MRALKIGFLLLALVPALALALAAGSVAAAPKDQGKEQPKDLVDVSALRDHMVVLHDGNGHYIIAMPTSEEYTTFFYGNGKTFYKQRVFGGGADPGNQSMSSKFWEPRVDHQAYLEQEKGVWKVSCGKRETKLSQLAADQAKKLVQQAVFRQHPWKYEAYALSRDDNGTYYYVDKLREEHGGKGFRLWVGPKGNMKRMKMTNIVSDSMGDIFATKKGELRFILSKSSATWVSQKDRKELVNVPVADNVALIYGELGVYLGDLGTPCDHF